MSDRASRKIPVTERQFLWVQDDDKGEVTLHVGPTMVSPTAADRVVVDDGQGGFSEDPSGRPQAMVEVGDNQYAVLANPLADDEGLPNGKFRPGRNEPRGLQNGTRSMVPGPCSFWLRPGQRAEVRDAHELASDQYLVVKVYGEVDRGAPFYDLTARSAAITRATSEVVGGRPSPARAEGAGEPVRAPLERGQLIVIRGLDTQLYIPPSGVDVVPDPTAEDERVVEQDEAGELSLVARPPRLVRRAVVLGEKEYCVILDADGKREIKVGPARVFPGPYDQFQVKGSRARIYDAYELLPQRALWLRVIAPIGRAELAEKLPRGVALDKEAWLPGDELLLGGVSAFFFPFNEIEVLAPATGEALQGNDHRRVFIEAIGIDQKSGIYVRDLATGEVRLVRGKQSYLVDPRREVQITRTVPAGDWNLWIAAQEPHKRTDRPVTTRWALSIVVPHGTAVLAASADGERVIEGPGVTLLGYEETLVALSLSTGKPKSDAQPLQTCFLRTVGNRVSDQIGVETADFVRISIQVSYSVAFLPAERARWFSHENYIQVMCDHLRSIVRSRCRGLPLAALWRALPQIVRDAILGERAADGTGRKGRALDNGAVVTEVEVLGAAIEDRAIAELMQRVQSESVTLVIGDRQAEERLASALLRAELDQRASELEERARERRARLDELERRLLHAAELAAAREAEEVARERQTLADRRAAEMEAAATERQTLAKQAELALLAREAEARAQAERSRAEQSLDEQARLRELEVLLIQARAQATVAERQAVQAGLIEALTALGDKVLLGEAAANMNLVSLFSGKDVASLLGEVLGGTRVAPTLRAMQEKFGNGADSE